MGMKEYHTHRDSLKALGLLFALTACLSAGGHYPHIPEAEFRLDDNALQRIEQVIGKEAESGRFSGVALIARKGQVLFEKAYGSADIETDRPNSTETRFLIYSTTKQLTAAAIMRLVKRGKLSLDDSVQTYIPEAPESWQPVNIHHLLTHTSGIPDRLNDLLTYYTGDDQSTLGAVIEHIEDTALASKPGEAWRYSNFGYQILLVVLERAGGKSYGDLLQEEIFDEAVMTDSGIINPANPRGQPKGSAPVEGLATGYNGEPENLSIANSLMYINLGAGGVYSTARYMLLYDDMLRKGEFLDCDTQMIMFTRGHEIREGVLYGYGWIIRDQGEGIYSFEHSGGTNGFTSQYIRVPRYELCIVLLSNYGFSTVGELGKQILEIALNGE